MDPDYFFCPNPTCSAHTLEPLDDAWFCRHGFHSTKAFGRVQRYLCLRCGKSFSDQTFRLSYWLKKPTDFEALGKEINSSSSGNYVARHHHLSADSLRIRQDRLARNALFLQCLFTKSVKITEALAADGLETFVCNQFFPVNLNILIGKDSEFLYTFNESHSRRKGRMTEKQRARFETIYEGKSFTDSRISVMFGKLIEYLSTQETAEVMSLDTDESPHYQRVIEQWNQSDDRQPVIEHHLTSSTAPRTRSNPLHAVNYFDRLLRKDVPNHRRETICQARNDRNLLSRFAYYVVTHNFYKPYRISSHAKQTERRHADGVVELTEWHEVWKERMHTKRFMRSFVELPEYFEAVWFRRTPTPLKKAADPVPKFAYQ